MVCCLKEYKLFTRLLDKAPTKNICKYIPCGVQFNSFFHITNRHCRCDNKYILIMSYIGEAANLHWKHKN